MRRFVHIVAGTLIILGVVCGAAWWLFSGYFIAAFNYTHASPEVKAIEQQANLSLLGQRYYYEAAPTIIDKPGIRAACAGVASEGILGCFTGRIYLLEVESPEFRSEMAVTGAHEMLHSAYVDLPPDERKRIEGLLEAELDRRQDAKLNARLTKYQDRESQLDEAYAIIGSEAPGDSLDPELRKEFDKYFVDRQQVVAVNQRFQQAFDNLEAKINATTAQLASRKRQLDELLAEDNIDTYNAQVDPYNKIVQEHNDLVKEYNDLGERFNRAIGNAPAISQ